MVSRKASKVNLSNKELSDVPFQVFRCRNIKKLNLSHNNIKGIPKEIGELTHLKNLDLSHNHISIIQAKPFELTALEVLILNNNKIKKLPPQVAKLVELKKLSLANNLLEALPDLQKLEKLERLDISNNNFKNFPKEVLGLKNLTHLSIGKNNFSDFPVQEIKENFPNLKFLYCYSGTATSVEIDDNYSMLQQVKGSCISAINLLNKNESVELTNNKFKTTKNIFISYSHKDSEYKDEVETTLNTIKYLGQKFDFWSDTRLEAGDKWKEEINSAMQNASIAINIISRSYMASKFIQEVELPALLKKAQVDGTLILNIIARKCLFVEGPLTDFFTVNDPNTPIQGETPAGQELIYYSLSQKILKHLKTNQD